MRQACSGKLISCTNVYATVKTNVLVDRETVQFVVEDEGEGFDLSVVPQSGDPQALKDGVGRGLVLLTTFMDEVMFEKGGRKVTLVKRI